MAVSEHRARVLLLEPKVRYHNPTYRCFTAALELAFETVRYGPGYVENRELRETIPEIVRQTGPVSAIFINRYFMLGTFENARSSLHCSFDVEEFLRVKPNFLSSIEAADCPMFGILVSFDGYRLSEEHLRKLETFPGFFFANQSESIPAPSSLPEAIEEAFLQKGFNDRFSNFVARNEDRIIPSGHTLDRRELSDAQWSRRRTEVGIPGAPYARRKKARDVLMKSGIVPVTRAPLQLRFGPVLQALKIDLRTSSLGIRFYNWSFFRFLSGTRSCYTDGSMLERPLRKFFEIPAAGSLLVCTANQGLLARGFVDGEHFIGTEPEDLPSVLTWVRNNPTVAERMVRTSQALVERLHTVEPRAEQLSESIRRIRSGVFRGARWNEGEVEFL